MKQLKNSTETNNWKTPPYIWIPLDDVFRFDFDPCPYQHDLTIFDGLIVDWKKRNFVNPPYDRHGKEGFIRKGILEAKKGKLVVFLIPNATETKIFQEELFPVADFVFFVSGRIRFHGVNEKGVYTTSGTGKSGSMIVGLNCERYLQDFEEKFRDKGILFTKKSVRNEKNLLRRCFDWLQSWVIWAKVRL